MPQGLIEGQIHDTVQGNYVATAPARESDLYISFVNLMWQRASFPDVYPLISSITEDFHNMATSTAKLQHFFESRTKLKGLGSRFASTELEYLVIQARGVFDLLQESIAAIWNTKVKLSNEQAERRRRQNHIPDKFSKVVLKAKKSLRTVEEIETTFGFPPPLAQEYVAHGPFFSGLREARDKIVHGTGSTPLIFDTERGFCVNPAMPPFNSYGGWNEQHHYNENIVSVLPWVAHVITGTIEACNRMMEVFSTVIELPREIAPGYRIYARGSSNDALFEILRMKEGASAWWHVS